MISVIIPAYNSEDTIIKALNSVKNQTYKGDIEIIVINDGSKDSTQNMVENYQNENKNINLILINQVNSGVSKARNEGLKRSKGEYICFLDSDDVWLNNKLEVQMENFNDDIDFICALRNNDHITYPYKVKNGIAEITLRKLLLKTVGQTSTAIFKRKILENTGYFDEKQKYSEDANYWLRISLNNKMILLNQKLVITDNDYGQKGLSSNFSEMELGVQKNIKEMFYLKKINVLEYLFFNFFSKIKYIRRIYL
ncbi:Glycosyltransferase involved in cell wall bisynthesis [Chryseobacterium oranimense]|uniref:Glycosyltransferase involved in cell wall bisynthesis n=1 Tax=Chryseobacterium oranimense TaxID=421058 RepID=A0A1M5LX11_9FLAO|nr:glycosyltransferase family A protein [Chryseobacterium oranimense]SHG69577.1 Glycosyltransferase involved in cell wall bisynthesis [Chryseobacterium oranimense]